MLQPGSAVFVLVDVQGKLAQVMHEKEALFENLCKVIRGMKLLGVPMIWVEQIPEKMGRTTDVLAGLFTDTDVRPIAKSSFSCAGEPAFMARLAELKRSQVLIGGIETHVCVYQTARDLVAAGAYDVQILADAVSSRTLASKHIGLERARACGAAVTSVETALFELMGSAEHPAFRDVLRLVK